jgi:geranylgeranyl diphosphate synthase, type I
VHLPDFGASTPIRNELVTPAEVAIVPDAAIVLTRGQQVTRPALERAVGELHPELSVVAAYHQGWCNADGSAASGSGGKAVRPTLVLLSAEATGSDASVAIPAAVAVELVHNFSILHDDVMDGDRMRRHRPTAWAMFGTGLAVLAGDALLALSSQILSRNLDPRYALAAGLLNSAVSELILGQAEDLSFERRDDVCITECLQMSGHKTAALLACSTSIGAVLAGAPTRTVEELAGVGRHLGLAFQAVDDLLGIWGAQELTGKPVFNDLLRNKKSLPIVAALNAGSPESRELSNILASKDLLEELVERAAELVEAAGGRDRALREVDHQLSLALEGIDRIDMPVRVRAELTSVARYLAIRTT